MNFCCPNFKQNQYAARQQLPIFDNMQDNMKLKAFYDLLRPSQSTPTGIPDNRCICERKRAMRAVLAQRENELRQQKELLLLQCMCASMEPVRKKLKKSKNKKESPEIKERILKQCLCSAIDIILQTKHKTEQDQKRLALKEQIFQRKIQSQRAAERRAMETEKADLQRACRQFALAAAKEYHHKMLNSPQQKGSLLSLSDRESLERKSRRRKNVTSKRYPTKSSRRNDSESSDEAEIFPRQSRNRAKKKTRSSTNHSHSETKTADRSLRTSTRHCKSRRASLLKPLQSHELIENKYSLCSFNESTTSYEPKSLERSKNRHPASKGVKHKRKKHEFEPKNVCLMLDANINECLAKSLQECCGKKRKEKKKEPQEETPRPSEFKRNFDYIYPTKFAAKSNQGGQKDSALKKDTPASLKKSSEEHIKQDSDPTTNVQNEKREEAGCSSEDSRAVKQMANQHHPIYYRSNSLDQKLKESEPPKRRGFWRRFSRSDTSTNKKYSNPQIKSDSKESSETSILLQKLQNCEKTKENKSKQKKKKYVKINSKSDGSNDMESIKRQIDKKLKDRTPANSRASSRDRKLDDDKSRSHFDDSNYVEERETETKNLIKSLDDLTNEVQELRRGCDYQSASLIDKRGSFSKKSCKTKSKSSAVTGTMNSTRFRGRWFFRGKNTPVHQNFLPPRSSMKSPLGLKNINEKKQLRFNSKSEFSHDNLRESQPFIPSSEFSTDEKLLQKVYLKKQTDRSKSPPSNDRSKSPRSAPKDWLKEIKNQLKINRQRGGETTDTDQKLKRSSIDKNKRVRHSLPEESNDKESVSKAKSSDESIGNKTNESRRNSETGSMCSQSKKRDSSVDPSVGFSRENGKPSSKTSKSSKKNVANKNSCRSLMSDLSITKVYKELLVMLRPDLLSDRETTQKCIEKPKVQKCLSRKKPIKNPQDKNCTDKKKEPTKIMLYLMPSPSPSAPDRCRRKPKKRRRSSSCRSTQSCSRIGLPREQQAAGSVSTPEVRLSAFFDQIASSISCCEPIICKCPQPPKTSACCGDRKVRVNYLDPTRWACLKKRLRVCKNPKPLPKEFVLDTRLCVDEEIERCRREKRQRQLCDWKKKLKCKKQKADPFYCPEMEKPQAGAKPGAEVYYVCKPVKKGNKCDVNGEVLYECCYYPKPECNPSKCTKDDNKFFVKCKNDLSVSDNAKSSCAQGSKFLGSATKKSGCTAEDQLQNDNLEQCSRSSSVCARSRTSTRDGSCSSGSCRILDKNGLFYCSDQSPGSRRSARCSSDQNPKCCCSYCRSSHANVRKSSRSSHANVRKSSRSSHANVRKCIRSSHTNVRKCSRSSHTNVRKCSRSSHTNVRKCSRSPVCTMSCTPPPAMNDTRYDECLCQKMGCPSRGTSACSTKKKPRKQCKRRGSGGFSAENFKSMDVQQHPRSLSRESSYSSRTTLLQNEYKPSSSLSKISAIGRGKNSNKSICCSQCNCDACQKTAVKLNADRERIQSFWQNQNKNDYEFSKSLSGRQCSLCNNGCCPFNKIEKKFVLSEFSRTRINSGNVAKLVTHQRKINLERRNDSSISCQQPLKQRHSWCCSSIHAQNSCKNAAGSDSENDSDMSLSINSRYSCCDRPKCTNSSININKFPKKKCLYLWMPNCNGGGNCSEKGDNDENLCTSNGSLIQVVKVKSNELGFLRQMRQRGGGVSKVHEQECYCNQTKNSKQNQKQGNHGSLKSMEKQVFCYKVQCKEEETNQRGEILKSNNAFNRELLVTACQLQNKNSTSPGPVKIKICESMRPLQENNLSKPSTTKNAPKKKPKERRK